METGFQGESEPPSGSDPPPRARVGHTAGSWGRGEKGDGEGHTSHSRSTTWGDGGGAHRNDHPSPFAPHNGKESLMMELQRMGWAQPIGGVWGRKQRLRNQLGSILSENGDRVRLCHYVGGSNILSVARRAVSNSRGKKGDPGAFPIRCAPNGSTSLWCPLRQSGAVGALWGRGNTHEGGGGGDGDGPAAGPGVGVEKREGGGREGVPSMRPVWFRFLVERIPHSANHIYCAFLLDMFPVTPRYGFWERI